jgi:hypothetical protein
MVTVNAREEPRAVGPASVALGASSSSMAFDEDAGARLSAARGGGLEEKRSSQAKSPTTAMVRTRRLREAASECAFDKRTEA